MLGNINSTIQLVEFSGKILSTGVELYCSKDEALAESTTVEEATKDLLDLGKRSSSPI